jgi:hypothetical protein
MELLLFDLRQNTVNWMQTDPAIGFPIINWIVPLRAREAYAATDDGRVFVWDGSMWRCPGRIVAGGAELRGLAVDASTKPAAVFVTTSDRVYVSRDRTQSWQPAMQGLPRSIECNNIHLLVDHAGRSRLHLSTYGRSTWVAESVEPR